MDSLSSRDLTPQERKKAYNRAYYQSHHAEIRKQQKTYREAHIEEVLAYGEQWRQSHREYAKEQEKLRRQRKGEDIRAQRRSRYHANPEPFKSAVTEYTRTHIEQVRARKRYHREANPELYRIRHKRYRQANPEKIREMFIGIKARRLTRKTQAGGSFTTAEWQSLKSQYEYICLCCGKSEPEIKLTADHVIPVSKHGSSNIVNIQPLCGSCNSKKHNKIMDYRVNWSKKHG